MNEELLILRAALDIGLVYLAYRLGKHWLYASIIVNLLLISVLGSKMQFVFGFQTNVGNVPYAGVFFAMYLLLENGKMRDAIRAIWLGVGSVAAFLVMMQLTLSMQSSPETEALSEELIQVLGIVPRIAIASIAGFIAAQYFNVWICSFAHEDGRTSWWLRLAVILMVAQLIDSLIFFSIAFYGSFAAHTVIESLIVGYAIKVTIGLCTLPLIYYSRLRRTDTEGVVYG